MEELDETSEEVIEKYICKVYGKKHIDKVNNVRRQIFWGKYDAKKPEEQLSCSKKFNSSMMPPCQKVLQQKIKRVHLITRRWVSSTRVDSSNDNPECFGWILSEDGSYKVKWFEGHVAPSASEISITEDRAWDSAKDFPEGMIIFSE